MSHLYACGEDTKCDMFFKLLYPIWEAVKGLFLSLSLYKKHSLCISKSLCLNFAQLQLLDLWSHSFCTCIP